MGIVTSELTDLFSFLLPGFVTSFLFYALTPFPKKSEFEAVVIALIYTVVIKVLVKIPEFVCLGIGAFVVFGEWTPLSETAFSLVIALVIGLLWSYLYNNDIIHKHLRNKGITQQTSYPSEWYGAFSETKTYLILHLKDGRRILGWPMQWPDYPDRGHFVLEDADWLVVDENGNTKPLSLINVDKIVIDANNVEMVEFVKNDENAGDT
ncbi:MAG: DUF6338 family protein [Spirochaetaceae bacterium]|jgi:hypothetical protein|nr:DUF6338 family protein [Spirochaetaceae bacterium]